MILTNTSALASRYEQTKAQHNYHSTIRRISSGKRILDSSTDGGAFSQAVRLHSGKFLDQSHKVNLQGVRNFLHAQQEGLEKVLKIYDRMETLAVFSLDASANDSDRKFYDSEFQSLVANLQNILNSEFNGRKLFSSSIVSGGRTKEIPIQNDFDLSDTNNKNGARSVVKSQSVDIGTNAGTISFRVNSGGVGDSYRIWLGDVCVFSAGSKYQGPTDDLGPHYDTVNFGGDGWRTSGFASDGDADTIEVTFYPGKETTYKITPGPSNDRGDGISNFNSYSNGSYENVYTNPVPENFPSTLLTLQIETDSIGIIYKKDYTSSGYSVGSGQGIEFKPIHPPLDINTGSGGESMQIFQKGFGIFDEKSPISGELHSLLTVESAKDALNYIIGSNNYYGEARSVLNERLPSVAAELNRIDREIEKLEEREIQGESAIGKLLDADMAVESTQLSKSKIQSDFAVSCISKSVSITNVLIPLTTNHFRGALLKA